MPEMRLVSSQSHPMLMSRSCHGSSTQYQVLLVRVASEEDYFAVKQEARPPLADAADLVDGNFIPVPIKYIRVTSCGDVKWSMNRYSLFCSKV